MTIERRRPPRAAQVFNRFAVKLAGSRVMPMWALVHHTGRTSGTAYATPVAVIPGEGVFYIGLPWGRDSDWVRNLRANGGTIDWKGRRYTVSEPTFVDRSEVLEVARLPQRTMLKRWPLADFLRVRTSISSDPSSILRT